MYGEPSYNVVFGPNVCGPSTKKVLGDTDNECAEDYLYYGLSPLELSRLEAGVLELTLEGSDIDIHTEDVTMDLINTTNATDMMDTVIKAEGDRWSPPLPPEG